MATPARIPIPSLTVGERSARPRKALATRTSPALPTWILSVDETLVHSRQAHVESYLQACAIAGVPVLRTLPEDALERDPRAVFQQLAGRKLEHSELADLLVAKQTAFAARRDALQPTPGAVALLRRLREERLRLVAISSMPKEATRATLAAAGLDAWMDEVHDPIGGDVRATPWGTVGTRPWLAGFVPGTVLLSSSPRDVIVASRAGISMIALTCGGYSESELRGACACYEDPAHLLAVLELSARSDGGPNGFVTLP
jgi:phosphoglycolate phosphatase-like HAD superfamily hydrolase